MKNTVLLLCILAGMAACKKESPPNPELCPSPTTSTVTTPTITATESALAGKWLWYKTESYSAGQLAYTYSQGQWADTAAYVVFETTLYNNTDTYPYQYYNESYVCEWMFYHGQVNYVKALWYIIPNPKPILIGTFPSGYPGIFNKGCIGTLTSNELILEDWEGNFSEGNRYYYHKQ